MKWLGSDTKSKSNLKWLSLDEEPKSPGLQKAETEVENKKALLQANNIPLPNKDDDRNMVEKFLNTPKNTGFLGDTLDLLSRGQYASANIAKTMTDGRKDSFSDVLSAGKRGLTGEDRTSYSDVLDEAGMREGWGRSALGFAGDVLLDPTTYLTLGTGAAAKAGGKATAKGLGKLAAKAAGKEAIDRGGLKFAGLSLIPQSAINKGLEKSGATKAAQAVRDSKPVQVLGKAFVSNFREAGTDKDVWDSFVDMKKGYQKTLTYAQNKAVDDAIKLGKGLTKEERELVTKGLQDPILLKGQRKEVIEAARASKKLFNNIGQTEVSKGLLKKSRKNYVPGIYPEKGKSFLEGLAPGKSLRASVGKHAKGKKFGTLQEAIDAGLKPEMDIAKLTGLRNVASKRAVTTQNFVDDVIGQFGKPISHKNIDTLADDMGVYLPKGSLKFFPQDTIDLLKATTKGGLIEIPIDMVRKGVGVSKNVPMVALPKQLADELNNFKKAAWDEGTKGAVKHLYDTPLNLWKAYATATNPGFHIRNALSNVFQTYLNNGGALLNPKNHIKAAGALASDVPFLEKMPILGKKLANATINVAGKEMSLKDAKELMKKEGVLNEGWFDKEIGEVIGDRLEQGIKGKLSPNLINPLSQKNALIKAGRYVGSGVENQARAFNFLADSNKLGDTKQATKNVDKYLFDYGDLTDFEKNVMRRTVPFYTWLRKNMPLQAEQLAKQPGKYAAIPKAIKAEERQTEDVDEQYLPEYMENWVRTPFKQGDNPMYWNPNMPYGDIDRFNPAGVEKNAFGMLSPLAKAPIEMLANRNFFFQSPIEKYKGELKKAPGYMPDLPEFAQKALGAKEVKNEKGEDELRIPAKARYLLQQVPFAENVSKAIDYDDDRLVNHMLAFLLGAKIGPYDIKKGKDNAIYKERQELRDMVDKLKAEGALQEEAPPKSKKKYSGKWLTID